MDKSKQPNLLQEVLKRATAAREDLKQKHPEFLAENKPNAAILPSTTEEHLMRASEIEKGRLKVTEEMRFSAAIKALNEGELP